MKANPKTFDLGIYSYRPSFYGSVQHKDEAKIDKGTSVAVIHPMRTVDPQGNMCAAMTVKGEVLFILKKNLRFNRTLSLTFTPPLGAQYAQEEHIKYEKAQLWLQQQAGTEGSIDFTPTIAE